MPFGKGRIQRFQGKKLLDHLHLFGFILCLRSPFCCLCRLHSFNLGVISVDRWWCRSPAGLFPDWRLLSKPLPGGPAAEGGWGGSSRVPRYPSHCHPGVEGTDDQTHIWRPLHFQSEFYSLTTLTVHFLVRCTVLWKIEAVWYSIGLSLVPSFFFMVMLCVSFQSQQARLATLYLPLFGLLQENVHRLDVKESTPLSNHNVGWHLVVGDWIATPMS